MINKMPPTRRIGAGLLVFPRVRAASPPAGAGSSAPPPPAPAAPPAPTAPAAAPAETHAEEPAEATPPRVSYLHGEVSLWRPGAQDWTAAALNMPLAPGDVLYAGPAGNVEIQDGPRRLLPRGGLGGHDHVPHASGRHRDHDTVGRRRRPGGREPAGGDLGRRIASRGDRSRRAAQLVGPLELPAHRLPDPARERQVRLGGRLRCRGARPARELAERRELRQRLGAGRRAVRLVALHDRALDLGSAIRLDGARPPPLGLGAVPSRPLGRGPPAPRGAPAPGAGAPRLLAPAPGRPRPPGPG